MPASGSGGSSISAKTLSAAVSPRCMTACTLDSVLQLVRKVQERREVGDEIADRRSARRQPCRTAAHRMAPMAIETMI